MRFVLTITPDELVGIGEVDMLVHVKERYVDSRLNVVFPLTMPEIGMPKTEEYVVVPETSLQPSML